MRLDDHPTVQRVRASRQEPVDALINADRLRDLCMEAGADDVGFVSIDAAEAASEREQAVTALPGAQTYIAICLRMNRDNVRAPQRSLANSEFHQTNDEIDQVARRIARALQDAGHRAVYPAAGFPQEMDEFPGRAWVIAHKVIAEAAGLGRMGIHRNVIHPRFGNFILLGTVITDALVDRPDSPIDFNPCLECKLCVAACPVGAITKDGGFDFQACYTHNYREFMSGFTDFVETIADSDDREDYRAHVPPSESASMWQSLSYKPSYKAAYCMAACPAGEDVIGPYLADRKEHLTTVVRPLQDKQEPVYVLPDSAAEEHVTKRFPHKTARPVSNGLPEEVNAALEALGPRPKNT
ncbi:epoxyqueuosine reductase [Actinomadura rudentiformis]|uniref:Epoxyqueuosine reductase n=1 Tax=Actinomadura rudentiformis TaxID=359158 RepID=A0A6H9ZCL6_9ACTN|nr:4Fe-4S binding protein [Actinomadura rudentiformis]KAB2352299.1 epoxyqueuosine reductase [Actinomadura rudentiformis]